VIAIALLVLFAGFIYEFWRAAPFSTAQRQGWAGVWRLACIIALVRVTIFAIGAIMMRTADWRQSLGYILALVGLPEIYAAKALRVEPTAWLAACSALLAASSFLWAALFRLPHREPMARAGDHTNR
jgi:hypothetical protein